MFLLLASGLGSPVKYVQTFALRIRRAGGRAGLVDLE